MELVTPGFGLIFWTTVTFLLLVFLLGKFAWKPILTAINEREDDIKAALNAAEDAKKQMAELKSEHEILVKEARAERDQILREAKETRDRVVAEAANTAKNEASLIMAKAQEEIKRDQEQAFKKLKTEVASLAIQAATIILKGELTNQEKQHELVNEYLKEAKLN